MRSNKDGVAAAETAMLTPILLVLLFGAFEMGKYFLDEHVLMKAVRDGARYAGRQSFASMPCGGTATNEAAIKNFVRFGNIAGTGNPRLPYWTNNSTITITITCDSSGTYSGIYAGLTGGAKRVLVNASIPYGSLFGAIGFDATTLNVVGQSHAAVTGI
jgi:Flp pilus assembly protein TadG